MPKVSIVLPTYNGEKYIRESIESVLGQTYQDWELIIVNDCSTDKTCGIIAEYEEADSRIRSIYNKVNQKLPKSLNIGFQYATGEYLTWTSDDNCYLPKAIEMMTEYLDQHWKISMVRADMVVMDNNGIITDNWNPYDNKYMYFNDCVGACFMYRKSVLWDVGEYDPNMFLVEDYDYWMRILIKYGEIGNIPETLYKYRRHEKSLTFTKVSQIKKQRAFFRKKYIDTIVKQLKNDKQYLCIIFYELKEIGEDTEYIQNIFKDVVPELSMDVGCDFSKKVILYGAGTFGDKAYLKFKDNVEFYADRDQNKVGLYKNGVRIISIDEMIKRSDIYHIVISVGYEKILDVLQFLESEGIKGCGVYQSIG